MVSHTAQVSLVWERPEPTARSGGATISRDQIALAAFEIADREGLHAVSVKRVASRLRIPVQRLETFLVTRDDLLDLMLDAAFAEIDPIHEGADWRSQLRSIAHATQQTAQRHPWLRALAGTRTPCGPNGLRHSERALAALDGIGMDEATMTQAVNTVLAYVYGYVQLEMLEPGRRMDEDAAAERRANTARYLVDQIGTGEFPTLARVFAGAGNLTAADAFETGLTYVLDGIAAQVAVARGMDPSTTADAVPNPEEQPVAAADNAGSADAGNETDEQTDADEPTEAANPAAAGNQAGKRRGLRRSR